MLETRFRTDNGLYADRWDRAWTTLSDYRGVNANMHVVEADLAAAAATGDTSFLDRALVITERVVDDWARGNDWRVPEHFDAAWHPLPDHHRDQPDHPFEPFGATVGHGLEWSRLVLQLRSALGPAAPGWMLPAATSLFDRATRDGWSVDGHPGFVYTTDWDGTPVVRDRMHWVVCEAICAAAALSDATGDPAYDELYRTWWAHAVEHWIDPVNGSWRHQLTPGARACRLGVARPPRPLPLRARGGAAAMSAPVVLVAGESLVDVLTSADGTRTELPGGSPANVAVALARLGTPGPAAHRLRRRPARLDRGGVRR